MRTSSTRVLQRCCSVSTRPTARVGQPQLPVQNGSDPGRLLDSTIVVVTRGSDRHEPGTRLVATVSHPHYSYDAAPGTMSHANTQLGRTDFAYKYSGLEPIINIRQPYRPKEIDTNSGLKFRGGADIKYK